ncbi:MAG: hypothetical protein H0X66_11875 [Verrucomicrobia bacterium]|nr:hypothetical protein [Verrucomicrobiota bacterium]
MVGNRLILSNKDTSYVALKRAPVLQLETSNLQSAIGLFAELGWKTVSAMEETFGASGTLCRETKGDVVLLSQPRSTLQRLNPTLPVSAIEAAMDVLTRDRSPMLLEQAKGMR